MKLLYAESRLFIYKGMKTTAASTLLDLFKETMLRRRCLHKKTTSFTKRVDVDLIIKGLLCIKSLFIPSFIQLVYDFLCHC
jgi:hypothetical protein